MPQGRTIAIGDVHGCDVALERLLDAIAPTAEDVIVQLGDLCDRGPDTRRSIDLLIDLARRCDLKVILGNHDEMMLGVFGRGPRCDRTFWESVGGEETIASYGGYDRVPEEHLDFLESCLRSYEDDSTIYVHANLEPDVPLAEQTADWLRWRKVAGGEPRSLSGKRVVCGHTSQKSGRPLVWDGWTCIDTRVFDTGWLTALDVGSDLVYRANQSGAVEPPTPLAEIADRPPE